MADISLYLYIACGIILILILWVSLDSFFLDKKSSRNNFSDYDTRERYHNLQQVYNNLIIENAALKRKITSLEQENRQIINSEIERQYIQRDSIPINNTLPSHSNVDFSKSDPPSEINSPVQEIPKEIEIRVFTQFDYTELNGNVKKVNKSKMYLKDNGSGDYSLIYINDIAIRNPEDLAELELAFDITNTTENNNRPMEILQNPIYHYRISDNYGELIKRGRIKYK